MAGISGPGMGGAALALLAAGCHMPTVSPQVTDGGPHVRIAASQVISSGSGGTTLYQSSQSGTDPLFADLDAMLVAPGGASVNQVGPMTQVSGPSGNQQVIQAAPNPATNLQGFLGSLFNQVGIGNRPTTSGQQVSQQGISMGSGIQQSSSSTTSSGGIQQQTISNSDGTVTVVQSGPAGSGVWRSLSQTYPQGNSNQALRSVMTEVTREGNCQETSRTRTIINRPDGTQRQMLNVSKEDVCTGESLGDVRAQVRVVNGKRQMVGTVTDADGSVRTFTRPLD